MITVNLNRDHKVEIVFSVDRCTSDNVISRSLTHLCKRVIAFFGLQGKVVAYEKCLGLCLFFGWFFGFGWSRSLYFLEDCNEGPLLGRGVRAGPTCGTGLY